MRQRFELRMSPDELKRLRYVAEKRKRSRGDAIRVLIDEEHERMVLRGEVEANEPTTERKAKR